MPVESVKYLVPPSLLLSLQIYLISYIITQNANSLAQAQISQKEKGLNSIKKVACYIYAMRRGENQVWRESSMKRDVQELCFNLAPSLTCLDAHEEGCLLLFREAMFVLSKMNYTYWWRLTRKKSESLYTTQKNMKVSERGENVYLTYYMCT